MAQPSTAVSQASWDTGTEIDAPFAGSLTDLASISALKSGGSAASTNPKLPPVSGSSVPTDSGAFRTLGSNVPTDARVPRRAATGEPVAPELVPGTRVGEYEIEGKIGEGAMGAVYRAVHPTIGKHVAVKIMNPQLCGDPGAVERFRREARSVAAIRHPGIVDVFGFGTLDDGRAYLIMEWLDGRSLGTRLEHGRLAFDEALDTFDQIARALDAAHDKAIIHRDLKPDNVFLQHVAREKPIIKILDFGLAKLANEDGRAAMTQTGALLGTPIYMSPEQCRGKGVDHRTDIYALGCIGYELICGRVPFAADNIAELMASHLGEPPPQPKSLWAEIPPQLDGLLFAMLAKDPVQRPTIQQVRQTIAAMRGSTFPTPLPGSLRPISEPPMSGSAPGQSPVPTARRTRPRRGLTIGVAAAMVLLAGILTFAIFAPGEKNSQPSSTAAGSSASDSAAAGQPIEAVAVAEHEAAPSTPADPVTKSSVESSKATNTGSGTTSESNKPVATKKASATATNKPSTTNLTAGVPDKAAGEKTNTVAEKTAVMGALALNSKPPAEILIDGVRTGLSTPQANIKLAAGRHRVTLINATSNVKESFNVEIRAGQVERVDKNLSDRATAPKGDANRATVNPFGKKKTATP